MKNTPNHFPVFPAIDEAFNFLYGNEFSYILHEDVVNEFHDKIRPYLYQIQGKENRTVQDNYFTKFTPFSRYYRENGCSIKLIEYVWRVALDPIFDFEKETNTRFHKGTPYYFLGKNYILDRNIEKGYILIHKAFEEDKLTQDEEYPEKKDEFPKTPASALITLDPDNGNNFRDWVIEIIKFLNKGYIRTFNNKYTSSMNFDDLRGKFLTKIDLSHQAYLFSYSISRVYDIEDHGFIYDQKNALTTQVITQIFFDILRIVEGLILYKEDKKERLFSKHLNYFRDLTNIYTLDVERSGEFDKYREKNPKKAFPDLLSNNYKFEDGSSPNEMDKDIMIALGIRNYYAHNTEPLDILQEKKDEIFERLFHLLFAVIEYLY